MAENTFLGLQPYTEADAYRFKGRTEESQELFRLIVRNGYTVCYAESGEGKTSLLNAGVFPLLRQNMYFPIAITFTSDDYERTPDSFDTIIDRCIRDSIAEYNETNKGINVEYKLCSSDFQGLDSQANLQQALSQYSWWKLRNYKPQAMGLTFTPVFVFDQFEEVFNMPGSIVWTKKFFDWLEDVSSDSCPDEIAKKVRGIIGDKAAFPTIKEEKDFKAVFSLRKEFIGELDYWGMQRCFIPDLKDNRYCLKALTYEGAKKVMTQQERFDEEKVEQILTHFVSQYSREPEKTIKEQLPIIPALLLSVVCDSWEKDISSFAKLNTDEMSQSLNKILEKFYDDTIDAVIKELLHQKTAPFGLLDSIRKDIDVAMFYLVDVNGKRVRVKAVTTLGSMSMNSDRRLSETLPIVKYKEILNRHRIIKITKIDGEDYVEIVHDGLCPIIAKRREIRLAIEAKEREKKLLQEQNRKMRKRLTLFSLLAIVVIGFMALFLWSQRETMTEREAKEEFRNQRDAVQKQKDEMAILNESLNKQIQINEKQNDSIWLLNKSLNENMSIVAHQRDSLNVSLHTQNELNQRLRAQMILVDEQKDIIKKQNDELLSSYAEIQSQYNALKAKNDSIQSFADFITLQNGIMERQSEIIERNTGLSMSLDMKNAYDACVTIRSAIESGSKQYLLLANNIFKKYDTTPFSSLRCLDDSILSLDGHFIYNTDFIDSIIAGKDVYSYAQKFSVELVRRGKFANGSIFLKNCIVGKKTSSKYRFRSRGHQEIAIVTEPGGMVSLRVYDSTNDKWYTDTNNVRKGMTTRFLSFDSGDNPVSLEIEVINTSDKDISFVVLSN